MQTKDLLMRISSICGIILNIISWCLWIIISDFCTNEDFWRDNLCSNNINSYKCNFTVRIGGSVIFMLVVLLLQIITSIILFIKVKPDKKMLIMYNRMKRASNRKKGGPMHLESQLTSGVGDLNFDPTKTDTSTKQLTTTNSYHARDIALSGATNTDPTRAHYIIKSSVVN